MLCKDGSLTAEQIASELKVSVSTVERSIKQLKDNGLIDIEDLERLLKHFLGNNMKKPINFDDTETLVLDFTSLKN